MSEPRHAQPQSASIRGISADAHAFAQVEKWMAMIRELGREPRDSRGGAGKELTAAGERGPRRLDG